MKKIGLILAAVLVLLLTLPLLMGVLAKRNLQHHFELTAQNKDYPFNLRLVDFNQGWFRSTATFKITGNNAAGERLITRFDQLKDSSLPQDQRDRDITMIIKHGPLVTAIEHDQSSMRFGLASANAVLNLNLAPQIAKLVQTATQNRPPLSANVFLSFSGETVVNAKSAGIKFSNYGSVDHFDFAGLSVKYTGERKLGKHKMLVLMGSFAAGDKNSSVNIDGIKIKTHMAKGLPYLPVGDFTATIKHMASEEKIEKKTSETNDLTFQFVTSLDGNKFNFSAAMNVGEFRKNDRKVAMNIRLGVDALDAKASSELYELINDLALHPEEALTPAEKITLGLKMAPLLEKALSGASFDVALKLENNKGVFDVTADLDAPERIDLMHGAGLVLIEQASGKASAVLSKKFFEDQIKEQSKEEREFVQATLKECLEKGWVKDEGSQYIANLKLQSGKVTSNGHEVVDLLTPGSAS